MQVKPIFIDKDGPMAAEEITSTHESSHFTNELQAAIQVRHIMTPRGEFVAGKDAAHARALLCEQRNEDLDLIPYPDLGDPTAYVLRSDQLPHQIDQSHLISDGTPVIDLIEYFGAGREALFVLTGNRISGLVHLSDLNSSLCKVAFFTLVNNIERLCLEQFRLHLPDALLSDTFSTRQIAGLKGRMQEMRQNDALPFDAAALYFGEILKLTQRTGAVPIGDDEIEILNDVRNRTAHAGHVLFSTLEDIAELKAVVNIARRVEDQLHAI